jgi:hypothetical protein
MTSIQYGSMSLDDLLGRFVEIGIAQDKALFNDDSASYNRLYRQMDQIDKELRARGRDARLSLTRLFDHPNLHVRLRAAARTLGVAPDRARAVIESIASSRIYPQAGDAGMLLSGLDDGTFKPS